MEVVQVIILLTLVFSALGQMPSSGSVGHKYDLEIQKVELMNKTDFVEFQGLKVKRLNKTFYVADGKFSMNNDFDDSWEVEVFCWRSKLGNNQWELTPLKVRRQPTSEFINEVYIESLYKDLGPFSDLPSFGDTDLRVFPRGTYTITNYVADVTNFPAFLQDGLYRIEIMLFNEGIIKSGFIVYWKVYPEIG